MTATVVFRRCVEAVREEKLIIRENKTDKEYHFQNWFEDRLKETTLNYEVSGRNTYPDFRMVATTEGYELKGLAYPGRNANFDSNSQVPSGLHNGRTIYYVFGRYPKNPDGNSYPVLDLVVCHGDFLNANHEYKHLNLNVKGFGTYGDLMIRDRKMYVVPTPFRLIEGAAHHQTLVLPENVNPGEGFFSVGELRRVEAPKLVVGYSFDLMTNQIRPETIRNPHAGREHNFRAWRLEESSEDPVSLLDVTTETLEAEEAQETEDEAEA